MSLKSLIEEAKGGRMLSFSEAKRMALKSPITHQGMAMEEVIAR